MNTTLKTVAVFAAGAIAGSVAGYFASKLIVDMYLKKEMISGLNDMLDYLSEGSEDEEKDESEATFSEYDVVEEEENTSSSKPTDYAAISARTLTPRPEIGDLIMQKYGIKNPPDKTTNKWPYVITMTSYLSEMVDYDKVSLTYYEEDKILADSEDVKIDAKSVIGLDSLKKFGEGSEDPHVVYVRNDRLATDYEVVLQKDSYSKAVLGEEEPASKPARKNRKAKNDTVAEED